MNEIKRFPRPIIRKPIVKRFPRPVIRVENGIIRNISGFKPIYELNIKPKDKYPELYERLSILKEKFKEKNRKLSLHCPLLNNMNMVSIETCICRCKVKCDEFIFRNLVGKDEGPSEYMDDFIKFQRLANIIYGTVREKDIAKDDLEKNVNLEDRKKKKRKRKKKK